MEKLKGIHVTTEDVSNIGGANAIKTFVENEFNTNSNLAYVLLIGDHAYVPSSSTSAGDSDNNYAYIVGEIITLICLWGVFRQKQKMRLKL